MLKDKYPYIIAEIGCNHNGDIDLAKKMIDKAKECGCDAIKLQLWQQEELCTNKYLHQLNKGIVKLENVDKWETKELGLKNIFEQVEKFSISYNDHIKLFAHAKSKKIGFSSTAITKKGIDFLIDCKADFLKIASMDINNPQFIEYAISKDYPILISTGLASLGEIEMIANLIPVKFRENVTLLHCVSLYPPDDKLVNLRFINTLRDLFDLNVGYSDHTLGFSIALEAVAYGATIIEKHFTLNKNMPGWDQKVSADPFEMKIICEQSRRIIDALGTGRKEITEEELDKRLKLRRSVVATRKIRKGSCINIDDIVLKRPGTGIRPDEMQYVIGRKVNRDIDEDETIRWEDLV